MDKTDGTKKPESVLADGNQHVQTLLRPHPCRKERKLTFMTNPFKDSANKESVVYCKYLSKKSI